MNTEDKNKEHKCIFCDEECDCGYHQDCEGCIICEIEWDDMMSSEPNVQVSDTTKGDQGTEPR